MAPDTSYRKPSVPASHLRGHCACPAQLPWHLGVTREKASLILLPPSPHMARGASLLDRVESRTAGSLVEGLARGPQPRLTKNKVPLSSPFQLQCRLLDQIRAQGSWPDTYRPGQGGLCRRRTATWARVTNDILRDRQQEKGVSKTFMCAG